MTDPHDLMHLLIMVTSKLKTLSDIDLNARSEYRRAEDAALASLVSDYGAKVTSSNGAQVLRIAGVTSSCTYGTTGLLCNWREACRRRIAKVTA